MSDDASTNEKSPIEQAVEVLVYAPIGLLFEGSTILPQLVEKGRSQVTMARVIGKFAVQQGRVEATRAASKLGDQAAGVLDFLGDSLSPVQSDAPPPRPAATDGDGGAGAARPRKRPTSSGRAVAAARTGAKAGAPANAAAKASARPAAKAASTAARPPAPDAPPASAAELAIPDYDGLSASHVVNRLAGLSADELEAVRAYEAANRGRKTILNKIAQLQSA